MTLRNLERDIILPDQVVLNNLQTKRLAALANVDEKEIAGKNIAQLSEQLKWQIDPHLFFFRKICGKVVKQDPVTGVEYPVPFATVIVEDTDCNVLIYHPINYPWSWHFPLSCTRETLATVHTDACGNFCVWIPIFDIDRILRWRKERICFPLVFKRPILKDLVEQRVWPPIPNPPDPGPLKQFERISAILNSVGGSKAEIVKRKIVLTQNSSTFGAVKSNNSNELNERLFDGEIPPPLSVDFKKALTGYNIVASKGASAADAIRSDIAGRLGLNAAGQEIQGFNPANYRGPFYRCVDIYVPEWQYVFDIPDITFRVTQDTNGDGVEETIYSESYFDVRWDEEDLTDIKLTASSIAKESRFCNTQHIPCGDVPDLLFAGFLPLRNPDYFDGTNTTSPVHIASGYELRTNRPIATGIPGGLQTLPPTASTPLCGTIPLYGCVEIQNAVYYRIMKSIDNGTNYSPITGAAWNNFFGSTPVPVSADMLGWYPVQPIHPVTFNPIPRSSLEFSNLLLDWQTSLLSEKSLLKIELGDASKNHIIDSEPVTIVTDNTAPTLHINTLAWKYADEPDGSLRDLNSVDCPLIKRGAIARNIEVIFEVFVAGSHFRDAVIGTSGCGGINTFVSVSELGFKSAYWYESEFDNTTVLHQRYSLSATSRPGCYSFDCHAYSRSINPDGAHGENLNPPNDWLTNTNYLDSYLAKSVAVVNEDL